MNSQDLVPENLLASISESVKQGLNIMDEKYKVMDVACSDSEEEDEGGAVVFRYITGCCYFHCHIYEISFILKYNRFTVSLLGPMILTKIDPYHTLLGPTSGWRRIR